MVYKVTALWIIPFFSALMWKRLQMENGTAVFIKTDLNGEREKGSQRYFSRSCFNLYYFESQGEIYGEYHPKIWENAYGVVVNVKQDGTIMQ